MAYLYRLICQCLALLLVCSSFTAFAMAPTSGGWAVYQMFPGNLTSPYMESKSAACDWIGGHHPPYTYRGDTKVYTTSSCQYYVTDYNGTVNGGYGYGNKSAGYVTGSYCPANSTGTTSCTCNSGYVEDSTHTSCVLPPQNCQWSSGQSISGGAFMVERGKTVCMQGCAFTLSSSAPEPSSSVGYGGVWFDQRWQSDFTGTGSVCPSSGVGASDGLTTPSTTKSTDSTPPPTNGCPVGKVPGTFNGATVCVDPGVRQETTKKTDTNNDGTNTTTNDTTNNTSCTGNSCVTTTTTNTSVTNNSTSTTTTSTKTGSETTTKDDYCGKNPYASICVQSGSGAGAGKGESMSDFCKANPAALACDTPSLGSVDAVAVAGTSRSLTIAADTGWGPSTGTCPASHVVVVMGKSVSMNMQGLCDFANAIRPLIIGMAWLSAALIFFGLGRKE